MSLAIYIISDGLEPIDRYKVGTHYGDHESLIKKYIDILPQIKIHCFIETEKGCDVCSEFRILHKEKNVKNMKGDFSDWYTISLKNMTQSIIKLLDKDYKVTKKV